MATVNVPDFLPSANGLRFANDFPKVPLIQIPVPGTTIRLGDASDGLCGGMTYLTADLARAGLPPPPGTDPPSAGPLFEYLVKRAFQSFDLPDGPLQYLLWMGLPDRDALFGLHGVVWRTLTQEWPKVRADLDGGTLSPLGLVRTRSFNPKDLGLNHQVLAYGYELDESAKKLRVRVCDPNFPGDDGVAVQVSLADPIEASSFTYVAGDHPVRGFFRTAYRWNDPSSVAGSPASLATGLDGSEIQSDQEPM